MNTELSSFAARLRNTIVAGFQNEDFDALAVELFVLQFENNDFYRQMCDLRRVSPSTICAIPGVTPSFAGRWTHIPFISTSAFKETQLSCIPLTERTTVFHSSGTTGAETSRHFHNSQSLAVYEASLWRWFSFHFAAETELVFLTPNKKTVPRSSLVHMFETLRQMSSQPESAFMGRLAAEDSWVIDFTAIIPKLTAACAAGKPLTLLGTAFLFVHLSDYLTDHHIRFQLPEHSRVMETGGYKNRSRSLPKAELHASITEQLGVGRENIICEYGMSELSSQAYSVADEACHAADNTDRHPRCLTRQFKFPPWARAQIISPETGHEVTDGEVGLIRIYDLANVFSVAAIQTEDLAIRRGEGFELIGRAELTERRGCSLMTA